MLKDILEEDGLYFLQIGHIKKNSIKNYVAGTRIDLIDTIIDHLERIKEENFDELYKEFAKNE